MYIFCDASCEKMWKTSHREQMGVSFIGLFQTSSASADFHFHQLTLSELQNVDTQVWPIGVVFHVSIGFIAFINYCLDIIDYNSKCVLHSMFRPEWVTSSARRGEVDCRISAKLMSLHAAPGHKWHTVDFFFFPPQIWTKLSSLSQWPSFIKSAQDLVLILV